MLTYDVNMAYFSATIYAISILISVALHHHLKDKDEKLKRAPQLLLGGIIIALEIIKQVKLFTNLDCGNLFSVLQNDLESSKDWYALPFHFCSFFFFWQILAIFSRGKWKNIFENMAFLWSLLIALFIILMPDSIYGGAVSALAEGHHDRHHTLVFHYLALQYFCNEVALKITKFETKKIWQGLAAFGIYAVIVVPASFLIGENFCSVLEPTVPIPWIQAAHPLGYAIYEPVLLISGTALCALLYLAIVGVRTLESKIHFGPYVEYGLVGWALAMYPVTLLFVRCEMASILFLPLQILTCAICIALAYLVFFLINKKTKQSA